MESQRSGTVPNARVFACYREFAPCDALRPHVRALFSFVPRVEEKPAPRQVLREVVFEEGDSFGSPLFADGHASMVLSFDRTCHAGGTWHRSSARPHGVVIGAMSKVGPSSGDDRPEMIGAYFRPSGVSQFVGVPASELTDRIVALEDVWTANGAQLPVELGEANGSARMDRLESALLDRVREERRRAVAVDAPALAAWAVRRSGRLTVQDMADAAGVSRQHLTRVFRECIGVTPKLYCRLARFQSGLAYATRGKNTNWAQIAVGMGYVDQSHMIAEFREFSSLTPHELGTGRWFHPFIERALFAISRK